MQSIALLMFWTKKWRKTIEKHGEGCLGSTMSESDSIWLISILSPMSMSNIFQICAFSLMLHKNIIYLNFDLMNIFICWKLATGMVNCCARSRKPSKKIIKSKRTQVINGLSSTHIFNCSSSLIPKSKNLYIIFIYGKCFSTNVWCLDDVLNLCVMSNDMKTGFNTTTSNFFLKTTSN